MFALGNAPKIQAKVHQELKEVFGKDESIATTKQLGELKYLDRVIKEALRLYPSAPSISRYLESDALIGKILIIPFFNIIRIKYFVFLSANCY